MEFAFIVLPFLVLVIVAVGVMGARANYNDQLSRSFQALARKHHGAFRRFGPREMSVEFRRQGGRYRVSIERPARLFARRRTVVEVSGWGDPQVDAMIEGRRIRNLLVPNAVAGPSLGFSMSYVVRGRPPDRLRMLISKGVCVRVEALRRVADGLRVELRADQFIASRRGALADFASINKFAAGAVDLCDEMIGVLQVGIDVADSAATRLEADVRCKICGEDFVGSDQPVVLCRKCQTPHHKDCWQFNGVCSTYACGEKRFKKADLQAASARSAQDKS